MGTYQLIVFETLLIYIYRKEENMKTFYIQKRGRIIISKYIIIPNDSVERGYLHLLEHMIIRQNFLLLKEHSIEFNGYTEEGMMTIEIMSNRKIELSLNKFSIDDLRKEILLITQERQSYPTDSILCNKILGSLEDIQQFNLSKLNDLLRKIDIYHIVYSDENINTPQKLCLEKAYIRDKEIILEGIPIHLFSIINKICAKSIFEINYEHNSFYFIDKCNVENAMDIIGDKNKIKNIFKLYCIKLKEYRFLDNEVCEAILNNRIVLVDLLNLVEEIDWDCINHLLENIYYSYL